MLSNRGMFGDFSPSQAKTIRMLAAVIFIWTWTLYDGKTGVTLTAFRENPQVIDWLARSRCFCRSGSGRLCLTVGSAARRNWRSEHLHAMDKKPYAFLLMFPRNLALAHRQQESSMLSAPRTAAPAAEITKASRTFTREAYFVVNIRVDYFERTYVTPSKDALLF